LLTALVMFSIGQATLFLVRSERSIVENTVLSQSDDYRNLGLIGSMDNQQI